MHSKWIFQPYDKEAAAQLSRTLGLSPITAALLLQRGLGRVDEARDFLTASLSDLTDGRQLEGVLEAVNRLNQAISRREKIVIYGDYDVDGICSIVILKECLERLGAEVGYYVPNRFREGYGLNTEAVATLARQGVTLLVTVDCGISSLEEISLATQLGIDVIVTDHHTLPPILPPAQVIINPKQDNDRKLADLAGAGVAFKLAAALAEPLLSQQEIYEWLELVAMATVADQVPLLGENRSLVKQGLAVLERTRRPGLKALLQATGLENKPIQSWQVGFILAPRLNSAGRMDSARTSVELLTCQDQTSAELLAAGLCQMNDERKIIEEHIYAQAVSQLEGQDQLLQDPILVVAGDNWHRGVIGIVASRLADVYHKPALVIAWEGQVGRGSARSAHDFDIYSAFRANQDLLLAYGGHRAAAGISISRDRFSELKAALDSQVMPHPQLEKGQKIHRVDLEICEEDIDSSLWKEIELLRPFGEGNPVPRFVIRSTKMNRISRVGKGREHLRFCIGTRRIAGIIFNRGDKSDSHLETCSQDLLFELDNNYFAGESNLQLKVRDVRPTFIDGERVKANNHFYWRHKLLGLIAQETEAWRPVVLIYPSHRSLLKHQGLIEYFYGHHNRQLLHGHLNPVALVQSVNQLRQGVSRVFLTTQPFWHYYRARFDLPDQLRLIVRLWPEPVTEFQVEAPADREVVSWNIPHGSINFLIDPVDLSNGKTVIYANLPATVRKYSADHPSLLIEAGLHDVEARKSVREDFSRATGGAMISDGSHTPGQPYIKELDRLILADPPLGMYELAAWTDYLNDNQPLRVKVDFSQDKLDHNRSYLNRMYPSARAAEEVLEACRRRPIVPGLSSAEAARTVHRYMGGRHSMLEIQAILRIAVDLGLYRYEKSGSIIATTLLECTETIHNWESSPYVLEGMAEKSILAHWEQELQRVMGW